MTTDQSAWSIRLIMAIVVMMLIFMFCTYTDENEMIFLTVLIFPLVTLLVAGYTLTYKGKTHLTSRILFFVLLAISILAVLAFLYLLGLAKAYSH